MSWIRGHAAVVLESLVLSLRRQVDKAKTLSLKSVFSADDFVGLQQLTARTIPSSTSDILSAANGIAMEWLEVRESSPLVLDKMEYLLERAYIDFYIREPESLTEHRLLDEIGIFDHNFAFAAGPSAAATLQKLKIRRHLLNMMEKMEEAGKIEEVKASEGLERAGEVQKSCRVLKWMLTNSLEEEKFLYHPYVLEQMTGVQSILPWFMTDLHQLKTVTDAEAYVSRLSHFHEKMDSAMSAAQEAANHGIVAPEFVLEKVADSMNVLIGDSDASKNILLSHFRDSVKENEIAIEPSLDEAAESTVVKSVIPSMIRLRDGVLALKEKAPAAGGSCHLPNGLAYYDWCLARETTTKLTAKEIHSIGIEQVANLQQRMKHVIVSSLGQSDAVDVIDFMRQLDAKKEDRAFFYGEEQKDQCLADFAAFGEEVDKQIDSRFDVRPKQPLEIRRVPSHMEQGSPAAFYMGPSMDGTRNGVFYVNVGNISAIQKYEMKTLYCHEAVPGHHYQIALQSENERLPMFRKVFSGFTAYVEGWALYAERVGDEIGVYSSPYDLLGHFGDDLFRCARLVVDTGIHAMGWSRHDARQYMIKNTTLSEKDIEIEVDRYCVLPGQACSYKIGQLKILELREVARRSPRYTDALFHRVVLELGAVPLDVLEETVKEFFAE